MKIEYDTYSTRDAFGAALAELAEKDHSIYAVGADTVKSMGYLPMQKKYPERVVNVGIAEQNMALVAAGIAACGGKAFAATYAPFASMRMLEQVRTFIAYPNLDVKIIAGMSGLSGNIEGVTHQSVEDVSLLRCIPNMVVVIPADACATLEITRVITEYKGPAYLRVGRGPVPKVFDTYKFTIGKANVIQDEGEDVTIFTNGTALHRVLLAEKLLRTRGIHARIVEVPCVKPFDEDAVVEAAKRTHKLVTVEENTILGGLGGAVAETASSLCPVPVLRLGIEDVYAQSGEYEELLDRYGLMPGDIADKIAAFVK